MEKLSFALAVVMERKPINNRWQSHAWQLHALMPDTFADKSPRALLDREDALRVLHPGFEVSVFNDEAEGYFLNVTSPEPCVFVAWRFSEDESQALPHLVTLSYNEAARWMDAQEKVERVAMPAEMLLALRDWVQQNYEPPVKKQRQRPKSFESKDGRYDANLDAKFDAKRGAA